MKKTFLYEIQISENNCKFFKIYVNDDSVEIFIIIKLLTKNQIEYGGFTDNPFFRDTQLLKKRPYIMFCKYRY